MPPARRIELPTCRIRQVKPRFPQNLSVDVTFCERSRTTRTSRVGDPFLPPIGSAGSPALRKRSCATTAETQAATSPTAQYVATETSRSRASAGMSLATTGVHRQRLQHGGQSLPLRCDQEDVGASIDGGDLVPVSFAARHAPGVPRRCMSSCCARREVPRNSASGVLARAARTTSRAPPARARLRGLHAGAATSSCIVSDSRRRDGAATTERGQVAAVYRPPTSSAHIGAGRLGSPCWSAGVWDAVVAATFQHARDRRFRSDICAVGDVAACASAVGGAAACRVSETRRSRSSGRNGSAHARIGWSDLRSQNGRHLREVLAEGRLLRITRRSSIARARRHGARPANSAEGERGRSTRASFGEPAGDRRRNLRGSA